MNFNPEYKLLNRDQLALSKSGLTCTIQIGINLYFSNRDQLALCKVANRDQLALINKPYIRITILIAMYIVSDVCHTWDIEN